MRLVLTIEGERFEVEVDPDRLTVEIHGRTVPVRQFPSDAGRIELEIAGERIVIDGWPEGRSDPRPRVSVNGEWIATELVDLRRGRSAPGGPGPSATSPVEKAPLDRSAQGGEGLPVFPPMPGRILEVHVTEGAAIAAGALLFVLEAMKMRNEIRSPVAGRAVDVAVSIGSNVRARDRLLRIVPTGGDP